MAVPGQIALNSLTPGVESITANYSNPSPGDTDRIYLQIRLQGDTEWVTIEIFDNSTFTVVGLTNVPHDVRLRAINDVDGFGPWSVILTATPSATTFAPNLVDWGPDGTVPGPLVNNTGTLGAAYNLDTQLGTTSNLSNQVRNGRPVWQSDNSAALSTSPTPPSPSIAQPCTIYTALVPFFVDGNLRWVMRGGFADIEIRARNDGWNASRNGAGMYAVGSAITDGRLYVIEVVVNAGSSSIRVLDDQGNDTGSVFGNMNSGNISPEVMAADVAITGGEDIPAQFMQTRIIQGIGTGAERQAVIDNMFQLFAFDAPNIVQYRTGDSSNALDPVLMDGEGVVANSGNASIGLDPVLMDGEAALAVSGSISETLQNAGMIASGSVEKAPFIPIASPEQPDCFRVWQHLLPRGKSWRTTIDKPLTQFIEGLSIACDDVKACEDLAYQDYFSDTTRLLDRWFEQYGLSNPGLTEQQRRDKLSAAKKALGSLSPNYIQTVLQDSGFDVYVHEWWDPGAEPPVGTQSCVTPRNPFNYLQSANGTANNFTVLCGEDLAECGEASAISGDTSGELGYALVNKPNIGTRPNYTALCGEDLAECGEALANCGEFTGFVDAEDGYVLPTDPDKWAYFVYIGGPTFPGLASVDTNRRDEFEALLLKHCPAHMWIGVLATFTGA